MKIIRNQENLIRANKEFTDREDSRAAFWKNYELCKKNLKEGNDDIRVLVYYGIGGIGKTELLKQLKKEMIEKNGEHFFVDYDLRYAQDSTSILEGLKNKLVDTYKFSFPTFELALYELAMKMGKKADAPEMKGFLKRNPFLNDFVSAISSVAGSIIHPAMGAFNLMALVLDKGVTVARNFFQKSNNKQFLDELDKKNRMEIEEVLPYYFALDLAENLKGKNEPMVIFLDTYEKMVNEILDVGEPLDKDLWLRSDKSPVMLVPNVLWVFAGREKLKWADADPDWEESLEQHLLGALSEVDGVGFLEKAGVFDENLRKELYDLSQGMPLYLDICVDRYTDLTNKSVVPTIDCFGQTPQKLISRFVEDMDSVHKDMVYMFSCVQVWTDDMMREIGPKIISDFSHEAYERLKTLSFVNSKEDKYSIHSLVASVLIEQCSEGIRNKAFCESIGYCDEKLNELDVLDENYQFYFDCLVEFATILVPTERLSFYADYIKDRVLNTKTAEKALMLLDINDCDTLDDSEYFYLLEKIGELLCFLGRYEEACTYQKELFSLCQNIDEKDPYTLSNAMHLSSTLRCMGRYEESINLAQDTLKLQQEVLEENHQDIIESMRDLAVTLGAVDRYDEALSLEKEVLRVKYENSGENDIDTLVAMHNFADTLSNVGRYKEALTLQEKVLQKLKENSKDNYLFIIKAGNNLAFTLSCLKRFEDALSLQKQTLQLSVDILGESHQLTQATKNNYVSKLCNLGRLEEALPLAEEVLKSKRELFVENHPSVLKSMNNLASILARVCRFEEALTLEQDVLRLSENDCHGRVRCMINITKILWHLNRKEEAIDMQQKTLALCRETFEPNNPNTIESIQVLAILLHELGRDEETNVLEKELAELGKE